MICHITIRIYHFKYILLCWWEPVESVIVINISSFIFCMINASLSNSILCCYSSQLVFLLKLLNFPLNSNTCIAYRKPLFWKHTDVKNLFLHFSFLFHWLARTVYRPYTNNYWCWRLLKKKHIVLYKIQKENLELWW